MRVRLAQVDWLPIGTAASGPATPLRASTVAGTAQHFDMPAAATPPPAVGIVAVDRAAGLANTGQKAATGQAGSGTPESGSAGSVAAAQGSAGSLAAAQGSRGSGPGTDESIVADFGSSSDVGSGDASQGDASQGDASQGAQGKDTRGRIIGGFGDSASVSSKVVGSGSATQPTVVAGFGR